MQLKDDELDGPKAMLLWLPSSSQTALRILFLGTGIFHAARSRDQNFLGHAS